MTEPASHLTLNAGASVHDRVGARVGVVEQVLCHGDGLFDGIVVATEYGLRLVDAHEVRNIVRGTVVLGVTEAEVEHGDPRRPNAPLAPRRGLRRMLGGAAARIPVARWGETKASARDRQTVVDRLKRAYVAERLTTDDLARCVARAQEAATLSGLEDVLRQAGD